jgi:DNA polymerase I
VDVRELAIYRRVSRTNYSRRCAEASAVETYQNCGLPLAPGMRSDMSLRMPRGGGKQERTAKEFDVGYYRKLLEKAWDEFHS